MYNKGAKCNICNIKFPSIKLLDYHIHTHPHKIKYLNTKICSYEPPPTTKKYKNIVVCGCIMLSLNTNREYIMVCINSNRSGKWGLPKGHLETKETFAECAIRETYEETGVRVKTSEIMGYIKIKQGIYFILYKDRQTLFNIVDQNEINSVSWLSEKQLTNLPENELTHEIRVILHQYTFKKLYMKGVCHIKCI